MSLRPESLTTPEVYYSSTAEAYARNSRNEHIQTQMTERALELLALDPNDNSTKLILDLGCGSGLSSATVNEAGHVFIGMDITPAMLQEAIDRDVQTGGDFILADMGFNASHAFRPGVFDGVVSISALQWLLQGDDAAKKLKSLFSGLHSILATGGRAVFQFYPDPNHAEMQIEKITAIAMKCGFGGGLVVDNPNSTKAKKFFLVLSASMRGFGGHNDAEQGDNNAVKVQSSVKVKKGAISKREKVVSMKERQRRQGREVRQDTKYTGRPRKGKF